MRLLRHPEPFSPLKAGPSASSSASCRAAQSTCRTARGQLSTCRGSVPGSMIVSPGRRASDARSCARIRLRRRRQGVPSSSTWAPTSGGSRAVRTVTGPHGPLAARRHATCRRVRRRDARRSAGTTVLAVAVCPRSLRRSALHPRRLHARPRPRPLHSSRTSSVRAHRERSRSAAGPLNSRPRGSAPVRKNLPTQTTDWPSSPGPGVAKKSRTGLLLRAAPRGLARSCCTAHHRSWTRRARRTDLRPVRRISTGAGWRTTWPQSTPGDVSSFAKKGRDSSFSMSLLHEVIEHLRTGLRHVGRAGAGRSTAGAGLGFLAWSEGAAESASHTGVHMSLSDDEYATAASAART